MSLVKRFVFLLCLGGMVLPLELHAQEYERLRARYPRALETAVTSPSAFVYEAATLEAAVVGRFRQGKEVLAYEKRGDFYAVATPRYGHAGYVLLTDLDVPQEPGAAVAPEPRRGYKEPKAATMMAVAFPGGGHLYAGETAKGGVLLGLAALGLGGGYALSEESTERLCPEELVCEEEGDYTPLLIGSAVALGAWAYGIFDAARAAERSNERLARITGMAPVLFRGGGTVRPGLAVRIRW